MSFFNEKWNNSSILTKASFWAMLLNTLLLLVSAFVYRSWTAGTEYAGGWLWFFVAFLINALLSFGILKVNGFARALTILQGLVSVLFIAFFIAGYRFVITSTKEVVGDAVVNAAGTAVAASSGLFGNLFKSLLSAIPQNVLAKIGFYLVIFLGPYLLQLLSMLILLLCGKDFKRKAATVSE